MKFLGFVVGTEGVRVDPDKVKAISDWPQPKNVAELRSFLGLATYFRKFMQGFSTRTTPLTALLKDKAVFDWTEECKVAFEGVKSDLIQAPVLALPDFTQTTPNSGVLQHPFTVICDASKSAIGALLMQNEHPIAFESRKMIPAELGYTVTEQELLAVVHALTVWRCYLEGVESTVVTDHNPLTFFQTQPQLSRRQLRWQEYLSQFKFKWEHWPGRRNVADPLSRHPLHMAGAIHLGLLKLAAMETRSKRARRVGDNVTVTTGTHEANPAPISEGIHEVPERERCSRPVGLSTPLPMQPA